MKQIIVWADDITPHLTQTFNSIKSQTKNQIKYIYWRELSKSRRNQGWKISENGDLDYINLESKNKIKFIKEILKNNPGAIHIFIGFLTVKPYFLFLILYLQRKGEKVIVIKEPYSPISYGYNSDKHQFLDYFKKISRPGIHRIICLLLQLMSKSKFPCIFTISQLAKDQLIKAGFPTSSIFPFGYFIEKNKVEIDNNNKKPLRIIYVGSQIRRKGLEIVMSALKEFEENGANFHIDFYGFGSFFNNSNSSGSYWKYRGVLELEDVQKVISKYDLLLLPSIHEGWGVVVNEALLQGVPVLLSSGVGARCLVSNGGGIIFETGDAYDLACKLRILSESPDLLISLNSSCKVIQEKITTKRAADYFMKAIDFYFFGNLEEPREIW